MQFTTRPARPADAGVFDDVVYAFDNLTELVLPRYSA